MSGAASATSEVGASAGTLLAEPWCGHQAYWFLLTASGASQGHALGVLVVLRGERPLRPLAPGLLAPLAQAV